MTMAWVLRRIGNARLQEVYAMLHLLVESTWCSTETAHATHVRLSGALPTDLIGTFPIAKNEGNLIVLKLPGASLESKRAVGCNLEFFAQEN
jgi:hypothetical protein